MSSNKLPLVTAAVGMLYTGTLDITTHLYSVAYIFMLSLHTEWQLYTSHHDHSRVSNFLETQVTMCDLSKK